MRECADCSSPILTYNNRGVSDQGVNKADHGIVYTALEPPAAQWDELPNRGESGMVPMAIRVIPDEVTEKLSLMARINYGRIYTIEHNVRVKSIGMVHPSSLPYLLRQNEHVLSSHKK